MITPNIASQLGLLNDGTDQTTPLNSAISKGGNIVVDLAGIVVNGAVNCNGKTLLFQGGTIIGTGTISNVVIDIDWLSQGFGLGITLINCTTTRDYVSAMLFGAKGDNTTDDQPALQKVSDTMIANRSMVRKLILPPLSFKINSPWMLHNWNGTSYGQWNLIVEGCDSVPGSYLGGFPTINGTSITNTFPIGVQRATGGYIKGVCIKGGFTCNLTNNQLFQTDFSAVSKTRDSRYSPNAGVVIDPFSNSTTQVPGDGGYPGMTSWYRGSSGNGGSTGFDVRDCVIQGFTVGVINSPNGFTQQGEDCSVINCQIDYCKIPIAYCQMQSDRTIIRNLRSWYYVWSVVDTQTYGAQCGTISSIDGINIAGYVKQIFNIVARKSLSIRNVYAENFFNIGTLQAFATAITVEGCCFDFYSGDYNVSPRYHVTATNVTFIGCRMRYYDDLFNKRLRFQYWINTVFINCFFDLPPYCDTPDYIAQINNAKFISCTASNYLLGQADGVYRISVAQSTPIAHGRFTIHDYDQNKTYCFDNPVYNYYTNNIINSVAISPVNGKATIKADTSLCCVNDIVLSQGSYIGRISAVNTVAGTIDLAEIPINITAGTYVALSVVFFLPFNPPFTGDIAAGSNQITNVVAPFGMNNTYQKPLVGMRYNHPDFKLGTYVTSVSGNTITLSNSATQNAINQPFYNGNPIVK